MRTEHLVFFLLLVIEVSSIDKITKTRAHTLITTKVIPALLKKKVTNLNYGNLRLCACTTGIGCSEKTQGWIPEMQLKMSRDERRLFANTCVTDGDCYQNAHPPPIMPVFGCIDSTHKRSLSEVSDFHFQASATCRNITSGRRTSYWICCDNQHFCANETTIQLPLDEESALPGWAIGGIIAGILFLIALAGGCFYCCWKYKSIYIVPTKNMNLLNSYLRNNTTSSRDIEMNCHDNEQTPIINATVPDVVPDEEQTSVMNGEDNTQSTFLGDSVHAPDPATKEDPDPVQPPVQEPDEAPAQVTSLNQLEKDGVPQKTIKFLKVLEDTDSGSGTGPARLQKITISKQITNLQPCGSGRFGAVSWGIYKGEQVAVKVFRTAEDASFNAEVHVFETRMLRHPNVLRYIGSDRVDNLMSVDLWIITEYQPNGSLHDFLKTRVVDMRLLFKLVRSMASGLNFLHQINEGNQSGSKKPPIAHRDLKSRNIMVKRDLTCAIGDFGLSLPLPADRVIPEKVIDRAYHCGTMRYLAPEILNRSMNSTVFENYLVADMYSQSLVIWEVLCRLEVDGIDAKTGDENTIPYGDCIRREPVAEDMVKVVCTWKLRPTLDPEWFNNEIISKLVNFLITCWSENPSARMTAYQGKRFLDELYIEYRVKETMKSSSTESSAVVEGEEEEEIVSEEVKSEEKATAVIPLEMAAPQEIQSNDQELNENKNENFVVPEDAAKPLLD
ncbi:unnamed protein product [Caenorhabditis brenneri]